MSIPSPKFLSSLSLSAKDRAYLAAVLDDCGYVPTSAPVGSLTGEETLQEIFTLLQIPKAHQPPYLQEEAAYGQARRAFGRDLLTLLPVLGQRVGREPRVPASVAPSLRDDLGQIVTEILTVRANPGFGERSVTIPLSLELGVFWGLQELAKVRATLTLIRELAGPSVPLIIQPCWGGERALVPGEPLATLIALLEDSLPSDSRMGPRERMTLDLAHIRPELELDAVALERLVEEGRERYRAQRHRVGGIDFSLSAEVAHRACELVRDARVLWAAMRATIPELYSVQGLQKATQFGFLGAGPWQTKRVLGRVCLVDRAGRPVPTIERARAAAQRATLDSRATLFADA